MYYMHISVIHAHKCITSMIIWHSSVSKKTIQWPTMYLIQSVYYEAINRLIYTEKNEIHQDMVQEYNVQKTVYNIYSVRMVHVHFRISRKSWRNVSILYYIHSDVFSSFKYSTTHQLPQKSAIYIIIIIVIVSCR